MSHRTQITLTDEQYRRLKRESKRTGVSLAELIRRRLEAPPERGALLQEIVRLSGSGVVETDLKALTVEGGQERNRRLGALDLSFGAWEASDEDGEAYVERVRRGLGRRLGSE